LKFKFLYLFAALALVLTLSSAVVPVAAQDGATWTFLVYMASDNDLEPFAVQDLMEMQAVGSSDEVNIVVQSDRAAGYEEIAGNWTDTRRFYVTQAQGTLSSGDFQISAEGLVNALSQYSADIFGMTEDTFNSELQRLASGNAQDEVEQIWMGIFGTPVGGGAPMVGLQQESIEQLDEIATGDPAYLVDFVTWGVENFPAERYALIMWDHGGGWTSFGNDESEGGDGLTLPEIDQALAEIQSTTGIEKFDLIAFDACLMSELEVFLTIAPYAQYTITSQETIPGAGWEYTTPLTALVNNPDMSVPEFGQIVVDSYMTFYSEVITSYPGFDLHVIDLSQLDGVTGSLDNFTAVVSQNSAEVLEAIGEARNNAQIFGEGSSPDETDYMSSTDLMHFMELLADMSPNADVAQAAQEVIDATSTIVLYGNNSAGLPNSKGVSVYFPRNDEAYSIADHANKYPAEISPAMASWVNFLGVFHGTANEVYVASDLSITITDVLPSGDISSIYDPPVVLFETNGQGIVNIEFVATYQAEDGTQYVVDQSPLVFSVINADGEELLDFPQGLSQNEFAWNVEMPVITDGEVDVPTVLLSSAGDTENAAVSGIYHWSDGKSAEAFVVFDLETAQAINVWGVDEGPNGQAVSEIKPNPGDQFEPTWRFFDEEGNEEIVPSGQLLTFSSEPFTYYFAPADSGDYILTMLVEDIAGNISISSATLNIDNADLDTSYRGFKDVSFGLNFLYPWEWTDPQVFEDEEGGVTLQITDPDGLMFINVEAYEVASLDELVPIAQEIVGEVEPEPIEVGGYDAYMLNYAYEDENGPRSGVITVVYVPDNNLGYVIDLDTSDEAFDTAVEVYEALVNSLTFFPPYQFE
jgi:hypothetical protein